MGPTRITVVSQLPHASRELSVDPSVRVVLFELNSRPSSGSSSRTPPRASPLHLLGGLLPRNPLRADGIGPPWRATRPIPMQGTPDETDRHIAELAASGRRTAPGRAGGGCGTRARQAVQGEHEFGRLVGA